MQEAPILTILIPNYNTESLTKLCLRLLRLHTDRNRVRVIVIDNQSRDGSAEYLRRIKWIKLIEREVGSEIGWVMHARALDEAFAQVTTPLVMVMHTDTLLISDGWLDYLLNALGNDPMCAGVGSWKLEEVSPLKRFGQKIETWIRLALRRPIKQRELYLRSHCALYRTELLRKFTRGFYDGETAGYRLFFRLKQAGYSFRFLPAKELMRYIIHLNHATMILNPHSGDSKTARPSAKKRLRKELERLHYREILAADSLDD